MIERNDILDRVSRGGFARERGACVTLADVASHSQHFIGGKFAPGELLDLDMSHVACPHE